MPDNNRLLFQSLGACRGDVVLGQGLHHAGSRVSGKRGYQQAGQGNRRQNQELDPAAASYRQPLQLDGENHDEHQPEPEGRHRDPEKGQGRDCNIPDGIGANRRHDAGRDAEETGQQGRRHRQNDRVLETRQNFRDYGVLGFDGFAEIQAHQSPEELAVLDVRRPIQSQLMTNQFDFFLGGHVSSDDLSGVPR